ncbi:MAG TPA: aminotransferase class I/II-fold pyridoxal phosphate-dependent enzyme [Bacillota bacterium]|nr:aminotransferase class I/II-fold pyridoxal phosphate-dependent enzyme [Bacillota bacterium]
MNRCSRDREQYVTPLVNALREYIDKETKRFHFPGHKGGRNPIIADLGLTDVWETHCLLGDVTELPGLDDLHAPQGAIYEAQRLAALAFGADTTFFVVNGSTCSIHSAILAVSKPGDKIAVSRDVHKAVIGGLILAGVYPVYIDVEVDKEFQIPLGPTPDSLRHTLDEHPDVRGVIFTNPNYYGVSPPVDLLVDIVHDYDKIALIDEAHGAHLPFHEELPLSGLEVQADVVVSGAHKTLPAMTQTSFLHLKGSRVSDKDISRALAVIETTSPSYVLMASLDIARKLAATRGSELLGRVIEAARKAQLKLNEMPGIKCLTGDHVASKGFRHDPTKLVVSFNGLHMTGFEAGDMLRQKHNIEVEFQDMVNVIAVLTMMDMEEDVLGFAEAVSKIAQDGFPRGQETLLPRSDTKTVLADLSRVFKELPKQRMTPREAVFSEGKLIKTEEAAGRISADTIVPYPPGVILICPGQEITSAVTDFIVHATSCGVGFHGVKDNHVLVVA